MPSDLPRQLRWKDFVKVLQKLGYTLYKNKRGSARVFVNLNREPNFPTFHEPHGSDPLRKGTLREYIQKLKLTKEEFVGLLEGD